MPAALCTWFCIVFRLGSARHGHDTSLCVSVRHNSRDLIRGGRIRSVPLSLASRSRCVPRYPVSCSLSAASALRTLFVPRVLEPVFACPSSIVVGSLGIVRYFWILLFEVRSYNVIDNDDIKGTVGYLHLSNECTYNVPYSLLEFCRCSPKK